MHVRRFTWSRVRLRRLNNATHRDLGYFFSALVVAYCLSGIALNHIDAWNPDFVIRKQSVAAPADCPKVASAITPEHVAAFDRLVGEPGHKVYDFPTPDQVKVYYDNATLHLHLADGSGLYEGVSRRPLIYQVNVLHRNSFRPWRWAADVFGVLLIAMNVTGLFVLRGAKGLGGRGKWLIAAGAVPPVIALVLHG